MEEERIRQLFRDGKADEVLLALNNLESRRPLHASELVLRGRCIQLGSGSVVEDYKEAEKAFRTALESDPFYLPALLELGWFFYALESEAGRALPFFEKALEVSLEHLREAIKGKADCLEYLYSATEAESFLQKITSEALDIERDFREDFEDDLS
jgi:tetratricopeptide (TPR) repeat protein